MRRTARGITCPHRVGGGGARRGVPQSWPGYPLPSPPRCPLPTGKGSGTRDWGTPSPQKRPWTRDWGIPSPSPRKDLGSETGVPLCSPPVHWQTENITSHRNSYAGRIYKSWQNAKNPKKGPMFQPSNFLRFFFWRLLDCISETALQSKDRDNTISSACNEIAWKGRLYFWALGKGSGGLIKNLLQQERLAQPAFPTPCSVPSWGWVGAEAELHGSFFLGMVPSSFRLMSGAEGEGGGVLADSSTDGQTKSENWKHYFSSYHVHGR